MKGCKYEMPRKAGLYRDLCGFEIANLSDHYDIRVLTQDCPQGSRKRHFDSRVNLGLADAVQIVLDGLLNRHDVERCGIQPRQGGIKRSCFAGPSGTGYEDNAMWLANKPVHASQRDLIHAKPREIQPPRLLVQQTQYGAFAVRSGNGGYAYVDWPARHPKCNPAILREAFFRNI